MKRMSTVLAMLFGVFAPTAAHSAPAPLENKQSICIPVFVEVYGDEPVLIVVCYMEGSLL
jgi:hypothetical protein